MNRSRLLCALALTAGLIAFPVISPVWAAPRPVKPAVYTEHIGGVDQPSLKNAPAAFDPARVDSAAAGTAPRVARTHKPAVLTTQLATGRFTAAGLSWSTRGAPQAIVVQMRIREKGTWSDWQSLSSGDGPDPRSADATRAGARMATQPISSPSADAIQVRVDSASSSAPPDLKLMTVDPGTSPADANPTGSPSATAGAATTQPTIITRAQWGADESMRTCAPDYSRTLKVGFVHHTVTSNSYAPSDSAGIVRGIYAYHVNGNGWCDIGYNFLVDRYGQVFEGRFGGMDRPVIGAQAGGFNTDTFGVAALGTFTASAPPAAMVTSIGRVMGWKLGLHGRNLFGSTVLTSGGGSYTGYPAGTRVPVGVVSGHRDVDLTECPGNLLYAQIPAIRQIAASYAVSNTTRDENLFGVFGTTTWPPSGKVEVHAQSLSSSYSRRLMDAVTKWSSGAPGQWRFFIGSSSGDTRPDLIGVHTTGTASGKVEVKVASWASYYQDTVVQTTTPMSSFTADSSVQMSVGGPSGGDLYFVVLAGTGSGTTEIHALAASADYTGYSVHSASALATGYATTQVRFLVAHGTGNLYFVLHANTGSGRSEAHALTAASGYHGYSVHAALPVGYTDDIGSQWVLGTGTRPDLTLLQLLGTGTQKVEAHKLSAASSYNGWSMHAATDLPQIQYPVWQFSEG